MLMKIICIKLTTMVKTEYTNIAYLYVEKSDSESEDNSRYKSKYSWSLINSDLLGLKFVDGFK